MELTRGLAGHVDHPIALGRFQGLQGGFQHNSRLPKPGRRFERDDGFFCQGVGEILLGVLLARTQYFEWRGEFQRLTPLERLKVQIKELGEAFEARFEEALVFAGKGNRLREPIPGFDKYEFSPNLLLWRSNTTQREVGRKLGEVGRILGAQLRFWHRNRTSERLNFAKNRDTAMGHRLVDAPGDLDRPAVVKHGPVNRDFKLRRGVFRDRLLLHLTMPMRSELCSPEPR